jgi:hypothetical protein
MELEALTRSSFERHLNTQFRMYVEGSRWFSIELTAVESPGASPSEERFSLVFQAPPGAPVEQRIYRLEHNDLGALEVFLVPIGAGDKGVCYEAVFNRISKRDQP